MTAQDAKEMSVDTFQSKVSITSVLFIDEAYELDPLNDNKGRPIVNEILRLCEDQRDDISVILAGYEDDFDEKFFNFNPGLRSRFKCIMFDDFDEEELATIWTDMRSKKKWLEEDGVTRIVVKRLSKVAGKKGFGNARDVLVRLEKATQEAMVRMGDNFSEANMVLSIIDVIGEDPRLSNGKLMKVCNEIEHKIGWERVKRQVNELVKLCGVNYGRELRGEPALDIFLNRMFLGNPGTGKVNNRGPRRAFLIFWLIHFNFFVQGKLPVRSCMVDYSKSWDFLVMVMLCQRQQATSLVATSANLRGKQIESLTVQGGRF